MSLVVSRNFLVFLQLLLREVLLALRQLDVLLVIEGVLHLDDLAFLQGRLSLLFNLEARKAINLGNLEELTLNSPFVSHPSQI